MRIVAALLIGGVMAGASCAAVEKKRPEAQSLPACITAKFYARPASFDPAGSTPPSTGDMTDMADGDRVKDQLATALNLADPKFVHRLCRDTTYILVDTSDPNGTFTGAYAFWQTKAQAKQPVRFISIPLGVFSRQQTYASYAQDLLNTVIEPPPSYSISVKASAGFSDIAAAALLAMIAHEEGHIIWQRHLRKNGADNPKKCPDGVSYDDHSWSSDGTMPLYHKFNTPVGAKHKTNDPYPSDIGRAARSDAVNHTTNADQLVQRLYSNRNFVSVFAALAPDEDAAEAYKYHVLQAVPGVGVSLNLPETGADIPTFGVLDASKIVEKDKCLSAVETDDS
jgi:hypothetical protein